MFSLNNSGQSKLKSYFLESVLCRNCINAVIMNLLGRDKLCIILEELDFGKLRNFISSDNCTRVNTWNTCEYLDCL